MADSDSISVSVDKRENGVVVRPSGEIDLSRSPAFRERLRQVLDERASSKVVVDLDQVPYMDSSGVATLVEALQIARRNSISLILCSLQDKVRSVFEIARLDSVFKIAANCDEALQG